jgi:hypothetical protein
MCLSKVTRTKGLKKERFGFKVVVRTYDDKYGSIYFPSAAGKGWKSKGQRVQTGDGKYYEGGVHAFVRLEDAREEHVGVGGVVVKVKLSGPICYGRQGIKPEETRVVVYRKMKILKEISTWP